MELTLKDGGASSSLFPQSSYTNRSHSSKRTRPTPLPLQHVDERRSRVKFGAN
jgi:hypothetical protein